MTEEIEKPIDDAEMDTDIEQEVIDGISDDDVKKHLSTTIAQKNHWREKAKKLAEDPRLKVVEEKKPEPKPKAKANDFDPEAFRSEIRDELRVETKFPDITEAEMAKAKALAKVEGRRLSEVVEDPYFQGYMSKNREIETREKARPNPSNRGGNSSGFSVADLNDPEKLDRMDAKEYAELLKKAKQQQPLSRS